MRTLKKTLCLVLCLVMMVGLCAIGANAAFTDEDKINYKEAVDLLTGIKVLNGKPDGDGFKFDPQGTLTRAEAAKIICYLHDMQDVTGTASFTDTVGHWAEGPIAYCANKGIVNGYGDGTFGPDDTLKGYQFGKMLLVALGYDADYEKLTGIDFEVNTMTLLKTRKLLTGIKDFDGRKDLTREMAAQMAFNALFAEKVAYAQAPVKVKASDGTEVVVGGAPAATNGEYLADNFDLDHNWAANATPNTAAGADEFGRPTKIYRDANNQKVVEVSVDADLTYNGTFDAKALKAIDKAQSGDYDFTGAYVVKYNGGAVPGADIDDLYDSVAAGPTGSKKAYPGYDIEIYADANKVVETICVFEWTLAQVQKEVVKGTRPVALVDDTVAYQNIGVVDNEKKTDDIYDQLAAYKDNSYIAVIYDGADILKIADVTTAQGKVTKINNDANNFKASAVVGGKTLQYANTAADLTIVTGEFTAIASDLATSGLAVGDEGTFFLDPNGFVIGYTVDVAAAAPEVDVYFVTGYATKTTDAYGNSSYKYFAQCVDGEGKEVDYPVKDAAAYALLPGYVDAGVAADPTDDTFTAGLKKVTLDAKGNATFAAATGAVKTVAAVLTGKEIKLPTTSDYYDGVKFVFVSGAKSAIKIAAKDGAQAIAAPGKTIEYAATGAGANKTVKVVFVAGDPDVAVVESKDIVFVAGDGVSAVEVLVKDKDGKEVQAFEKTVWIDGKESKIVVAAAQNDGSLGGYYTYTKNGDIYTLSAKAETNLKTATAVTNMYNGLISTATLPAEDMAVAGATLVNCSGNTKVPANASALAATETVAIVLSADLKTIQIIYVTASTR